MLVKAGKSYARLVPLDTRKRKRQPGRLVGKIDEAIFRALPEETLAAWERK